MRRPRRAEEVRYARAMRAARGVRVRRGFGASRRAVPGRWIIETARAEARTASAGAVRVRSRAPKVASRAATRAAAPRTSKQSRAKGRSRKRRPPAEQLMPTAPGRCTEHSDDARADLRVPVGLKPVGNGSRNGGRTARTKRPTAPSPSDQARRRAGARPARSGCGGAIARRVILGRNAAEARPQGARRELPARSLGLSEGEASQDTGRRSASSPGRHIELASEKAEQVGTALS